MLVGLYFVVKTLLEDFSTYLSGLHYCVTYEMNVKAIWEWQEAYPSAYSEQSPLVIRNFSVTQVFK